MGKVAGQKVKLYLHDSISGKLLAGQRSCTLNRSAETLDSTSKSSEGNWSESIAGQKSWSIDADGAFVVDDEAYSLLEQRYIEGEPVTAYIEMPSGNKYVGNCIITDLPIEANYDDLVTYSVSLTGTGALNTTTADLGSTPIA